ncbi:FAD-binding protein [Nonomuraea sp. PA05]|uniref:FAD-dependent oxidoreductase n=1 Tax=Nonomuraea sp. PA05 TaxID=2604466 RepID=UPI0011D70083|nr:FAD-dependent oxidoreductase [Nonomuraea sp. PA05]TYB51126.1 FAD-binding protein [Nonomuraea sp. PA05]
MAPFTCQHDVVVVGAGPAGLTAAAAPHAAGLDTVCVEARDRTGGRPASTGDALAQRPAGVQRITGNPIDAPAYRYGPGAAALTAALTAGLAAQLPDNALRLSTPVTGIRRDVDTVEVRTAAGRLNAGQVVLAIAPAGQDAAQPEALHVQDRSSQRWAASPGIRHLTDYDLFGHPLLPAAGAGRLHGASTETATGCAGHVEGALLAGERAAHAVLTARTAYRPVRHTTARPPTIGCDLDV